MPNGLIVKALSGYYYVLAEGSHDSEYIQCRARGVFKKRNISPLVGDRVAYELTENGEGTVTEILPRSSELVRPPIATWNKSFLCFRSGSRRLTFRCSINFSCIPKARDWIRSFA